MAHIENTPGVADSAAGKSLKQLLESDVRPGALQIKTPPPLSLYVHWPWCLKKCPYCDFNSHAVGLAGEGRADEARYLAALRADLEASLPLIWGRTVRSVFIGGGTPSLISPEALAQWLQDLRALLPLAAGCEITLEANPGTFERERFRAFGQAGVTRLSIGVQSFCDDALRALGRAHDRAQALAALEEAAASFAAFNLDLMYALPRQSLAALEDDLRTALAFAPPHLSAYHLTVEPHTLFARQPPPLPDDDTAAAMLDLITERTEAAGLRRYEVSAYARPGQRCAHNLNYWHFGDYLGLGAGAHGKLSFAHSVLRQVKWRDPATYMREALAGRPVSNQAEVSRCALPFEFMLNALRLRDGFDEALFTQRTGLPFSAVAQPVAQAIERGWLAAIETPHGRSLRPTARGYDFLSDLQALFL